jgi:hypothetical protein
MIRSRPRDAAAIFLDRDLGRSWMRRGLTALAAALTIALAAVAAAHAEPQDDARVAVDGFMSALLAGDAPTACAFMSTRLQSVVAQDSTCAESFTFEDSAESQD